MKKLVVVGTGPGDPELFTFKGARVLKETPVVFYPAKVPGERGTALEIVSEFIPPTTPKVELVFPMVREREALEKAWKANARIICSHEAPWGVFVTLGCPQVYSTFYYLLPFLEGMEIEVVPGVTSFSACSARLGEPLVLGGEAMAVLSASHLEEVPWEILGEFSTLVFMKIPKDERNLRALVDRVTQRGFKRVFYLLCCGMEGEVVMEGLPPAPQGYLALLIFRKG